MVGQQALQVTGLLFEDSLTGSVVPFHEDIGICPVKPIVIAAAHDGQEFQRVVLNFHPASRQTNSVGGQPLVTSTCDLEWECFFQQA